MLTTRIYILLVFSALYLSSCTHEPIIPDQQISFDTVIRPIITNSCQHAGCHGQLTYGSAFPLNTYDEISNPEYVIPGNPKNSKLYKTLISSSTEDKMPRDPYLTLSTKNINSIYVWIAQGAKDN